MKIFEKNLALIHRLFDTLYRKLQLIDASTTEADLRVPPGNRLERLSGEWNGWCSIRVNKQYRLIFKWDSLRGEAHSLFLDPHEY